MVESNWGIEFYKNAEKFFETLSQEKKKSLAIQVALLKKAGNQLQLPHSRSLGGGLFELREQSFGLRLYYVYEKNKIIIVILGGDKKSQQKDIIKARKIKKELDL